MVVEVDDHGQRHRPGHVRPRRPRRRLRRARRALWTMARAPFTVTRRLTRAFRRALAVRDWEALAALLAPDLTVNDHRLLGWETLHGPAPYIRALQSLVDLAPDVQLRLDNVLAMSERGVLYAPTWIGTRDGGAFEEPSLIVAELRRVEEDPSLRPVRPRSTRPSTRALRRHPRQPLVAIRLPVLQSPNAATAAIERVRAAFEARDWAAMRAACAPGREDRGPASPCESFRRRRVVDRGLRRRIRRTSTSVDSWLAPLESVWVWNVSCGRGGVVEDKADAPGPEGPFEIELLWVTRGRRGWTQSSRSLPSTSTTLRAANR